MDIEPIENLAHYLPYELRLRVLDNNICTVSDRYNDAYEGDNIIMGCDELEMLINETDYFKPILRPLSLITPENTRLDSNTVNAIKYVDDARKLPFNSSDLVLHTIQFTHVLYLIERHFDVFRLIEQDLAIDQTTLIAK